MADLTFACNEIPFLDQKTFECSTDHTVRWLNRLAEEHNALCAHTANLTDSIEDILNRLCELERRVDELTERMDRMDERMDRLETRVERIEERLQGYDISIQAIQNLFDTLTELLPMPYGQISAMGYKLAIGNIDVLNGYNGDRSRRYGIFTTPNLVGSAKDVYHDDKPIENVVNLLPYTFEEMSSKNYKFAVGNINVLSANNGTPTLNIGIVTSKNIEANDIYFN